MISSYRPFFNGSEVIKLLFSRSGRPEFEAALANQVGARFGVAFSYGRSGLIALLKVMGLHQAEVIMPAYTCSSVVEAVIFSGNKPVFVDIALTDYNINPDAIRSVLTPQTRAIIATHMFGYPLDVAAIRQEIKDSPLLIIEDAALALPTKISGGNAAIYSLGRGKQLYTISGGVVVTNDSNLYERLLAYRQAAMNRLPPSVWARRTMQIGTAYLAQSGKLEAQLLKLKKVGPVKQARESAGLVRKKIPVDYDTKYSDFQSRLGLAQLTKLDTLLERARTRAQFYYDELQNIPGLTPPPLVPQATYTYYSVRVAGRDAIDFRGRMFNKGVEVGRNFNYALPSLPAYQAYANGSYPCAERAAKEIVNLPNYPGLTTKEANYVIECVRQVMQESATTLRPDTRPQNSVTAQQTRRPGNYHQESDL